MLVASEVIQVLAVNCPVPGVQDGLHVVEVNTAAAALAAIRVAHFDVLLTSAVLNSEPVWVLARKMRAARPKLRWWLVERTLPADDEVIARTIGVARILDAAPDATVFHNAFRPTTSRWAPTFPTGVPMPAAH